MTTAIVGATVRRNLGVGHRRNRAKAVSAVATFSPNQNSRNGQESQS
ncbi:hypothetical protein [Variovorax sp. OV700]|nr:hypothetical protein [Variovorax sp. OV700]